MLRYIYISSKDDGNPALTLHGIARYVTDKKYNLIHSSKSDMKQFWFYLLRQCILRGFRQKLRRRFLFK